MNTSLHLSKFSPLRTPDVIAAKEKAVKYKRSVSSGLCHEVQVSDAESVASAATRDIRSIARSVGERMARKSSFESSDEDLFITQPFRSKQSGPQSQQTIKKPSSPARVKKSSQPVGDLDSDSSVLTDSDDSESDNDTSRKKPTTVLSPSGKSYTLKKPSKSDTLKTPPVVGSALDMKSNSKLKGMSKDKKAAGSNSEDSDEETDLDSDSDPNSQIIPVISPVKSKKQLYKHGIKTGHSKEDNVVQSKNIKNGQGEHRQHEGSISEMFGNSASSGSDSEESDVETGNKQPVKRAMAATSDTSDSQLSSDSDNEIISKKQTSSKMGKSVLAQNSKALSPKKLTNTLFNSKTQSSSSESSSEEESDEGADVNRLKLGTSKDSGVKSNSDESSIDEEPFSKVYGGKKSNSKKALSITPVQDVRSKHSISSSSEEDNVDTGAQPKTSVSVSRKDEKEFSEDSDTSSESSDNEKEDMDVDETDGKSKKVLPKSSKTASPFSKNRTRKINASSDSSSDEESDEEKKAAANSLKQGHSPSKKKERNDSSSSGSDDSDEEIDANSAGKKNVANSDAQSKRTARIASSSSDSSSDEARKKHIEKTSKRKSLLAPDSSSEDSSSNEESDSAKRKSNKKLKIVSSSQKRKGSLPTSDLSSNDEDVRKKNSKSSKGSVSRSKNIARKDSISSENSSEDSDDNRQGKKEAAKTPLTKKKARHGSMSSSSDEDVDGHQPDEEAATAIDGQAELRFSTPKNFEVKQVEDIVARASLKGKKIFLISTPADFDVSMLDGQSVDMSGNMNIITGGKSDKQYEVSCLPVSQDHTTSLCTVASDQDLGSDALALGPEVGGQLLVMNWIPQPAPVVLQKPALGKHSVPDDLKPHFTPFGSRSPPRYTIEKEVSKSHKKSKAKKRHKKSLEMEEVVPVKKEKLSEDPVVGSGSAKKHGKDKTVLEDSDKTEKKKKKKKHKKERKD